MRTMRIVFIRNKSQLKFPLRQTHSGFILSYMRTFYQTEVLEMKNRMLITIGVILLFIPVLMNCSQDTGDTKQLTEVKDSALAETQALEGAVIDATKAAGGDEDIEGNPEEGIVTPPGGDDEEPPVLPKRSEREIAEPIKGKITMDDLVYPTYDIATGKKVKGKAGSEDGYTQTTAAPCVEVWLYYSQILKGRQQETSNNINEDGVPHHASFVVKDGRNVFNIDLMETSPLGPTMINISRS